MCLTVIALDVDPRYTVVVAANRDEFHARPAQSAHWWETSSGSEVLAGRDLQQGGTWLGVTRRGRWGFVTNVREPGRHDPRAPSRGALVPTLLGDARPIDDAMAATTAQGTALNGFNLVGGEGLRAAFGSNRGRLVRALPPGVHGVSNADLDTPWPKLMRARRGLAAWITSAGDLDLLFDVLADRTTAADADLPSTGITRERERLLSSPFIVSADYGTRCSTVLTIARDGDVRFVERSFDSDGRIVGVATHRFRLEPVPAAVA